MKLEQVGSLIHDPSEESGYYKPQDWERMTVLEKKIKHLASAIDEYELVEALVSDKRFIMEEEIGAACADEAPCIQSSSQDLRAGAPGLRPGMI